MDQAPLVTEQIEAGARLARDFDACYKPLSAAYWLKRPNDYQRYLHLVSGEIDDSNFDLAYGEVIRLLGSGPHHWLNPFQVNVEGTDDPIAKAVLELQHNFPGSRATVLRDQPLAGRFIEEVYIYPLPITAAN